MQFDANKEESEKEESVKVESEKEQCMLLCSGQTEGSQPWGG